MNMQTIKRIGIGVAFVAGTLVALRVLAGTTIPVVSTGAKFALGVK